MLREHLGPLRIIGLALGLAGIIVINSSDLAQIHPKAPLAAAVMLISPIVVAFSSVLAKMKSRVYSPFALAAFPMIYGGLTHVILWFILERERPLAWSWPGVGIIAYLTVFGSILTFGGYYWLLRHYEVGRLNLLAYLTPLVAVTLGFFAADELLTPRMLLGAAVVLVGVGIANRSRAPRKRAAR
jgi:drug/metabolite transporter (DMT)-like permease